MNAPFKEIIGRINKYLYLRNPLVQNYRSKDESAEKNDPSPKNRSFTELSLVHLWQFSLHTPFRPLCLANVMVPNSDIFPCDHVVARIVKVKCMSPTAGAWWSWCDWPEKFKQHLKENLLLAVSSVFLFRSFVGFFSLFRRFFSLFRRVFFARSDFVKTAIQSWINGISKINCVKQLPVTSCIDFGKHTNMVILAPLKSKTAVFPGFAVSSP